MLLARVTEEKEHRIECYERVLRINPKNNEARIGLVRMQSRSLTLPLKSAAPENPWQPASSVKGRLQGIIAVFVILFGLGTTTYVIARNNPESNVARLILPATSTPFVEIIAEDVAPETRAQVSEAYPQYAPLVDALIGFAVKSAESGMEGAPERPGAEIIAFEGAGDEVRAKLQNSLPQPGSLSSLTLSEQELTSWLTLELNRNPDLPLSDVQVYLRDDRIQIWGMVTGGVNSTSVLIVGTTTLDLNGKPGMDLESVQIGQQLIPDLLVTQAESWLNQLITEAINQQVPGLEVMNINISSGLITISGMR